VTGYNKWFVDKATPKGRSSIRNKVIRPSSPRDAQSIERPTENIEQKISSSAIVASKERALFRFSNVDQYQALNCDKYLVWNNRS